jgi:hypothetical protein
MNSFIKLELDLSLIVFGQHLRLPFQTTNMLTVFTLEMTLLFSLEMEVLILLDSILFRNFFFNFFRMEGWVMEQLQTETHLFR